jgi:hypothetical protein
LQPAGVIHNSQTLKFFRINHRDEQIDKQREGNKTDDDGFHKILEFFAPAGVKFARHKKQGEDGDENQVGHRFNLSGQNLEAIAAGWLIENCCKSVKKLLRIETRPDLIRKFPNLVYRVHKQA